MQPHDSPGTARRLLAALIVLLTITASAAMTAPLSFTPAAVLADDDDADGEGGDDDDDGGNGNSGEGGGGDDDDDEGRGRDKEKDKDDPADHDQGQGNDDRPANAAQSEPVSPLPEFRLVIECAPLDDGRSACLFVGLGNAGVKRVAVPQAEICATVQGNSDATDDSFAVETLSGTTGEAAVVADDDALLLVLDGEVKVSNTTTYWIWADDDQLYPATGPALACGEAAAAQDKDAAASAQTTGAVIIRAFICGPEIVAGANVDWYAACTAPATGATFSVQPTVAGTAVAARTGETGDDGQLTVGDLSPGAYQVDQTDGNWCHAESDNVDDQGDVIVEPGVEATIWVFDCQQ